MTDTLERAARVARERGPAWLRDVLAAHKVVRLSEISRSDLKNLLHDSVACEYTTPPLRRTYPVKLHLEIETAADAKLAMRVCEFFAAQDVAADTVAPVVSSGATRATRKPSGAKRDPVEQFDALAKVAGVPTTDELEPTPLEHAIEAATAADAAVETVAPVVSEQATPADTRTHDELVAAVRALIMPKGINWVKEHVIEPFKTTKLSELTDDQLRSVERAAQ